MQDQGDSFMVVRSDEIVHQELPDPKIQRSIEDYQPLDSNNSALDDLHGRDFYNIKPNPIFVVLVVMTGFRKPEKESLAVIDDLLGSKFSVGMIGGRPGKAYYIVGNVQDEFIYLDPHLVQVFFLRANWLGLCEGKAS